jgi:hypothetical protein
MPIMSQSPEESADSMAMRERKPPVTAKGVPPATSRTALAYSRKYASRSIVLLAASPIIAGDS